MRVKCITKFLKADLLELIIDIEKEPTEENVLTGNDVYATSSDENEYDLFEDIEYEVKGIMVIEGKIRYLIKAYNSQLYEWFPMELFEITNPKVNSDWVVNNNFDDKTGIDMVISFKDISFNYNNLIHTAGATQEEMEKYESWLNV